MKSNSKIPSGAVERSRIFASDVNLRAGAGNKGGFEAKRLFSQAPAPIIGPRAHEVAASHVYIIQRGENEIKIGISKRPKARLSSLQVSSPDKLTLVHSEKPQTVSAIAVETALKVLLRPWRKSGEWFRCGAELGKVALHAAIHGSLRHRAFIASEQQREALRDAVYSDDGREQYRQHSLRQRELFPDFPDLRDLFDPSRVMMSRPRSSGFYPHEWNEKRLAANRAAKRARDEARYARGVP